MGNCNNNSSAIEEASLKHKFKIQILGSFLLACGLIQVGVCAKLYTFFNTADMFLGPWFAGIFCVVSGVLAIASKGQIILIFGCIASATGVVAMIIAVNFLGAQIPNFSSLEGCYNTETNTYYGNAARYNCSLWINEAYGYSAIYTESNLPCMCNTNQRWWYTSWNFTTPSWTYDDENSGYQWDHCTGYKLANGNDNCGLILTQLPQLIATALAFSCFGLLALFLYSIATCVLLCCSGCKECSGCGTEEYCPLCGCCCCADHERLHHRINATDQVVTKAPSAPSAIPMISVSSADDMPGGGDGNSNFELLGRSTSNNML